jgi:hypothetical protein
MWVVKNRNNQIIGSYENRWEAVDFKDYMDGLAWLKGPFHIEEIEDDQ